MNNNTPLTEQSTESKGWLHNYEAINTIKQHIAQLQPVQIGHELTDLPAHEKEALLLIIKAAHYMDAIFLLQVYHQNPVIAKELQSQMESNPDYKILYDYFKINFGPFDRLNHNRPFINLHELKPLGAGFYPPDVQREELAAYIQAHPEQEAALTSSFTCIFKTTNGWEARPYSTVYSAYLVPAADLLRQAAEKTQNASLRTYLRSRADAFLSNDYFQSDMDWMDLCDHEIEVVIGPYEVYEDELFGYKAAFEAFVTLVDHNESKKLAQIGLYCDALEKHLPLAEEYKNFSRGKSSPIMVVNVLFTAGDTKAGIQTTAFNLPNDERVRQAKGSKKVMLKNVAQQKYQQCWLPIASALMDPDQFAYVSFAAYFNHVLMHEVSHGLGPGLIQSNGRTTTVSKELKELYALIEETKADILSVWNVLYLTDQGVFPEHLRDHIFPTFLGGIFRSVRFGIGEAHGGANAIQFNYILEKGGFTYEPQACIFRVDNSHIREAVRLLAQEVLTIEALGDYEAARCFKEKYAVLSEPLQHALAKVAHAPIDIRPIYAL